MGDVMGFIRKFDETYGPLHPTFYQGTYSQVRQSFDMVITKAENILLKTNWFEDNKLL